MPVRQSVKPVVNRAWVDATLDKLSGSDTVTVTLTPVLHLIGATPPALTRETLQADLTAAVAVFSGYGSVTPTLSGPSNLGPNADGLVLTGSYLGHSTATFTPDTVKGYWLQSGDDWVVAELFAPGQEVPIGSNGDWLDLVAWLPLSSTQPLI